MADRDGRQAPAGSRALLGWITRALLAPDAREAFLGDLEEDFRKRAAAGALGARGARGARSSYRRDALRSAGALLLRPARPHRSTRPGDSLMHALYDDLRLAARNLLRAPGLSLVVVLTLALGIGSVIAVYTLIDGVVLRPLPPSACTASSPTPWPGGPARSVCASPSGHSRSTCSHWSWARA